VRSREQRALRSVVALGAVLLVVLLGAARAGERRPIKIAMFADLSSVYSQVGGMGAIEAARMAIQDFGAAAGARVDLFCAAPHKRAARAAAIARKWYAEGVDVIADVPNSAVALSVQQVSREARKILLVSSAASDDLTGPNCSPYSVHWTYDTYAAAHGTARAIMNSGGDSWFFITADYAFGYAMERDAGDVIRSQGGTVLGSVRSPLGTTDFSQYLLQAKTSGAKVVGLAIAGQDMINAIREASQFSVVQDGQRLAGLLVSISDVHSLGLKIAQGLRMTSAYYWDQNDATRAWAARFFNKTKRMPTMLQAGVYGALTHYLKAVQAVGGADADVVMAKMHETPINDFMTHDGKLRIDGRVMRDMYLFAAKTPAQSKFPWDYLELLQTIPAGEAFRPLDEGGCPLASNR
jgi:branched-chain amino acid transport system substrate-binding protein